MNRCDVVIKEPEEKDIILKYKALEKIGCFVKRYGKR